MYTSKYINEVIGRDVIVADMLSKEPIGGPVHVFNKKELKKFEKKTNSMFDQLIKACSKIPISGTENFLTKAKIFNFEGNICLDLKNFSRENREETETLFNAHYKEEFDPSQILLPFPCTAIVTPDAATILQAIKDQSTSFMFISLNHVHGESSGMTWFSIGVLKFFNETIDFDSIRCLISRMYLQTSNGKFKPFLNTSEEAMGHLWVPMLGKSMKLLAEINTPDKFIMEVSPIDPDVRSKKYIPKSHQRPEYILLKPHEIRQYMRTESEVVGHKKVGHERRAHLRRYPNDTERFPNAAGKVIQIPALWIGSTESTVGNRHYRVIL
jgi:hypothetical protein